MADYVFASKAEEFLSTLPDGSVDLFVLDPPYFEITNDAWDNQWESETDYIQWLVNLLRIAFRKTKPHGSMLVFGGVGKDGGHPFFDVVREVKVERVTGEYEVPARLWTYRNWITWKKRRAYGKSHDYLFTREEIVWFSKSPERTEVTFNIPLLDVKRGYEGYNKDYPAKSEFKRVSNVWDDITELFKPERSCQKPIPLLDRIVKTHSNPGDFVVDFFAGWGTTGVSALGLGRDFLGCEAIPLDAQQANDRCLAVACNGVNLELEPEWAR